MGNQKGITTGLSITHKNYVTRELLAAMLFNTLTNRSAHVVTLKSDGKNYVEEENNARVFPTLGETYWKLHRFTTSSGKTYPEDKKLQMLDPFGRPTNPKWMALVDGAWVQIGTDSKALYSVEHSAGKITRAELEKLYYETFSVKDGFANTEYYVDGDKLGYNETVWEKSYYGDDDYDKLGGVDVTVEVYMMADKYTAISSEKDLKNLYDLGDSYVDRDSTWPRMRVVIVHHYAAKVTQQMIFGAGLYTDTLNEGKSYTIPGHLELPYDRYNYAVWQNRFEPDAKPGVTSKKVILPMTSADQYGVDDVLYFQVAIQKDKNGKENYNVLNVQELTGIDGIAYVDPERTYVRPAKTDDAKYISYFMQVTETPEYKASRVTAKDKQTVYLDPTGKYVALVSTAVEAPKPYVPADYLYIESIQIKALPYQNDKLWNDKPLEVKAVAYDVLADGAAAKSTVKPIELQYQAIQYDTNKDGKPDTYRVTSIAGYKLEEPITVTANDVVTYKFSDATPSATTTAIARTTDVDRSVYGQGKDTVYYMAEDTGMYIIPDVMLRLHTADPDADPIEVTNDVWILDDGTAAHNPEHDNAGKIVYFTVYDGVAYVLNMHKDETSKATAIPGSVVNADFAGTKPFDAYCDHDMLNAASDYSYFSIYPEVLSKANAAAGDPVKKPVVAIDWDLTNQFARVSGTAKNELYTGTVTTTGEPVEPTNPVYTKIKSEASTLTYNLVDTAKKTYKAYDRDKNYENVVSGILTLNGSNSIKIGTKTVFVNESTILYSFDGDWTFDGIIDGGFRNLEYKGTYIYGEFDKFGVIGEEYYCLVVCDPTKDYEVATHIVVISIDPEEHDYNTTSTGIYCGFTEQDGNTYVYFVNPANNKMKTYKVEGDAAEIKNRVLRTQVGHLITFTTIDQSTVSVKNWSEDPEVTVLGFNTLDAKNATTLYVDGANYRYNLDKATIYYAGKHYLSLVDKTYLSKDAKVYAHLNGDETVTIVIVGQNIEDSFDDNSPYYGTLDTAWPWMI